MERISLFRLLRRRTPRLLGGLLLSGAFLLAGSGDATAQHACPHHDDPAASSAGAPTTGAQAPVAHATHHDGHGEPGASAPHGGRAAELPEGQAHGSHDRACTCMGACQGSAAAAFLPVAQPAARPVLVSAGGPVSVATESTRPSLPAHVLPFANGPPAHD